MKHENVFYVLRPYTPRAVLRIGSKRLEPEVLSEL